MLSQFALVELQQFSQLEYLNLSGALSVNRISHFMADGPLTATLKHLVCDVMPWETWSVFKVLYHPFKVLATRKYSNPPQVF